MLRSTWLVSLRMLGVADEVRGSPFLSHGGGFCCILVGDDCMEMRAIAPGRGGFGVG